mmetsp:Transcript_22688/g.35592  ORF Transcript_22688/g.35592 Transcript_22688/m.35592 type:complete len:122 (-) Transcript_22688:51-416(-)
MDSCVYAFKLKFILKARMDRLTDMCKIRKHTKPLRPVRPKTPATHPATIPINERILSILRKLDRKASMLNTSLLLSSDDGPIMLFMSVGPPEARSAIGSIMVWLMLVGYYYWCVMVYLNQL